MTNAEYRAAEGISKSELWNIAKSPLHFKYMQEHKQEDTPALLFGRAAHKYILERDTFNSEFAISPNVDRRTKSGKEAYAEFMEENAGKDVITADDCDKIIEMAAQIDADSYARELLTGTCESSIFWTDADTGEKCKCRPDCISNLSLNGRQIIADYKTCDSCQDGFFERNVKKYGYRLQAGMYCEGLFNANLEEYSFVFVAQEKTPPYAVRVYECSPEFVLKGYDTFRELIGIYHKCKITNNWGGYNYNGLGLVTLTE